jgi:hypothetical protein
MHQLTSEAELTTMRGEAVTSTNTPMSPVTRLILWFIAGNALAGALTLLLFPAQTDTLFFWPIKPPINAAVFGALYLGGAAIVGLVAYRGIWEPARFLVPILVSAGFLISVTTLLHLDKFTADFKLLYWVIIYVGAPVLALYLYAAQERQAANWTVEQPVAPAIRVVALMTGVIVVILGILLLISPTLAVTNWPWPSTPLMVRIFASWITAFGVGLLWFRVERDWSRLRHVANLMIAAGVLDLSVVFLHHEQITSVGVNLWVYCFHLVLFGLVGLLMHGLQHKYGNSN